MSSAVPARRSGTGSGAKRWFDALTAEEKANYDAFAELKKSVADQDNRSAISMLDSPEGWDKVLYWAGALHGIGCTPNPIGYSAFNSLRIAGGAERAARAGRTLTDVRSKQQWKYSLDRYRPAPELDQPVSLDEAPDAFDLVPHTRKGTDANGAAIEVFAHFKVHEMWDAARVVPYASPRRSTRTEVAEYTGPTSLARPLARLLEVVPGTGPDLAARLTLGADSPRRVDLREAHGMDETDADAVISSAVALAVRMLGAEHDAAPYPAGLLGKTSTGKAPKPMTVIAFAQAVEIGRALAVRAAQAAA